jgi:hypothetical protein
MNKRRKWIAALAALIIIGMISAAIYTVNRGVPAVDVAAYIQPAAAKGQAAELQYIAGDLLDAAGMKLAARSEALDLYFDEETTEVAVLDKKSGKLWRSNPEHRDDDTKATPYEKELMSSQFSITFRDTRGRADTYLNYSKSIANKQFEVYSIDNGIRIVYTLGDMSVGIDALPKLISKSRMDEKVLSKLDEATARFVITKYYPLKENPEVLERLDAAVSRELTLGRVIKAFAEAGYTEEDLMVDNEENGISEGAVNDKPNFTIPLEYRLEEDSLLVSVPVSEIVETEGFRIRMLNVLEFFGAAGAQEQGYMLVPDGTGSLIYLNNGKFMDEVYAQRLYGEDENDNSSRRGQVAASARLPVFGMKSGNYAWFAEIVSGDAIANINADVSGRSNMYNKLFTGFAIRGEDTLDLYKGNQVEEIKLLTDRHLEGEVAVRYSFLSGDDANYSGMARYYRQQLENNGVLKPLGVADELPFYVSILGAIDKRKTILGVPYKGMVGMTTFEEAGQLVDRLNADGISNIQMRYLGWFNEGVEHEMPGKVKVDKVLGGTSDLKALHAKLNTTGGGLYPDIAFQHVYQDNLNFAPASDAARFITREQALRTPYNRAFNAMDYDLGIYYLLSPAKLPYYVDQFMKGYDKYNIDAVSLRDLGDLLHADYRVNRLTYRETAKHIVIQQLERLSEAYSSTLTTGGNRYALPYTDQIVNVPTSTSLFNITDAEIPFYQMVIHGYVDYAGSPINLDDEQDIQTQLLKSVELGAAPHFLWSDESSSKLKFTRFDWMFSTQYTTWYDQALDMYKQQNQVLSDLRTQKISEHIIHQKDVVEVRYEGGTSVYVNYSDQAVAVDGIQIDARSYTTGGGVK